MSNIKAQDFLKCFLGSVVAVLVVFLCIKLFTNFYDFFYGFFNGLVVVFANLTLLSIPNNTFIVCLYFSVCLTFLCLNYKKDSLTLMLLGVVIGFLAICGVVNKPKNVAYLFNPENVVLKKINKFSPEAWLSIGVDDYARLSSGNENNNIYKYIDEESIYVFYQSCKKFLDQNSRKSSSIEYQLNGKPITKETKCSWTGVNEIKFGLNQDIKEKIEIQRIYPIKFY